MAQCGSPAQDAGPAQGGPWMPMDGRTEQVVQAATLLGQSSLYFIQCTRHDKSPFHGLLHQWDTARVETGGTRPIRVSGSSITFHIGEQLASFNLR